MAMKDNPALQGGPSTDSALIGDTANELHTKSLPKRTGPNFGYGGGAAPGTEYRVTNGETGRKG